MFTTCPIAAIFGSSQSLHHTGKIHHQPQEFIHDRYRAGISHKISLPHSGRYIRVNTPKIPPIISPLKSPNKETEGTKDEIIHLSFCATNESEAVKHNGFPNSQLLLVSNKNPNNFFYSSKVKSSKAELFK